MLLAVLLVIALVIAAWLYGYYNHKNPENILSKELMVSYLKEKGLDAVSEAENKEEQEQKWDLIPMVMVDGVIYVDTGIGIPALQKANLLCKSMRNGFCMPRRK